MDGDVSVELEVMLTGELTIPDVYAFRPHGGLTTRLGAFLPPKVKRAPCLAFAVRHPSAGTILVDTGLHPDAREDLRKDFGTPMGLFFATLRPAAESFDEQLSGLGVEPQGVECVVMTHLHVDHTSGMRLLPRAEFVCAREEWSAATGSSAGRKGYVRHHLPPASRVRSIDFDRDGARHGVFSRSVDLLGDGSVRLLSTPGHTRGHLSVLLRLPRGRRVLLVGDAAYALRNIHEQVLPLVTADDKRSRRSLSELKSYADGQPAATLVPSHDPQAWHAIRA